MSNKVVVYKNRTNVLQINLGYDVSTMTITSQIRSETDVDAPLIMDWEVDYLTDGTDGKLLLTVDNLVTEQIQANSGYMDLKRVDAGEPYQIFDIPLEVDFRGVVTE